tara:strand:+ start:336 stop:623 length:288 start_codon:yes stop_codon:yes gene_type:complete
MNDLKKKKRQLKKELKALDKMLNTVKRTKKRVKDKIINAEKSKRVILGKRNKRHGQKRGAYLKTKLKKIWLPSQAAPPRREYETNEKGEVIVRFD